MSKTILTIGFELASEVTHYEPFDSKASLLDWDIILFKPEIEPSWKYYAEEYQGKPCLSDTSSFAFKEACEHWRREIKQAVETGKTVIVFLPQLEEVFVATGEKQYSGTGRNARTNRFVTLHSNYNALPLTLRVTDGSGSAIKLSSRGGEIVAPYWKEFGSLIDKKEVILCCSHGDDEIRCAATNSELSKLFVHYFNELWSASTPIKEGIDVDFDVVAKLYEEYGKPRPAAN